MSSQSFNRLDDIFHVAAVQFQTTIFRPFVLFLFVFYACPGDSPIMFTRMVQVYYLAGAIKLFVRNIPYPERTIANYTNITGSVHPTSFCFFVETLCKEAKRRGMDRAGD